MPLSIGRIERKTGGVRTRSVFYLSTLNCRHSGASSGLDHSIFKWYKAAIKGVRKTFILQRFSQEKAKPRCSAPL